MEHSPTRDRPQDQTGGHVKDQSSISDYIAYYGNDEWRNSRPLSFIPSHDDTIEHFFDPSARSPIHDRPSRSPAGDSTHPYPERYPSPRANGAPMDGQVQRSASTGSQGAGTPSSPNLTRSPSQTATQAFPLNDIDYESSAAAVAQELSNLQAIRRMSMNVMDTADPDLATFNHAPAIPARAPPPGADEDDTSRLFWVPARLHPELAPKDYRTFVEDRVERIRRRAGSDASLPDEGVQRAKSNGSLGRSKSTLSRTINSGEGYEDGAEILERKKSQSQKSLLEQVDPTLQELETMVNDPAQILRSFDTDATTAISASDEMSTGDVPILPPPPSTGLKRSTRTAYRNTSLKRGERLSAGRRGTGRLSDDGGSRDSGVGERPVIKQEQGGFDLVRSQTEPIPEPLNNERPMPGSQREPPPELRNAASLDTLQPALQNLDLQSGQASASGRPFHSRIASNGRTTAQVPAPIPQIVETPPSDHRQQPPPQQHLIPARSSSHEYSRTQEAQNAFGDRPPLRPAYSRTNSFNRTLDDMASKPAMMIGANTRTDNVTFIPTFSEQKFEKPEKKADRKAKEKKEADGTTRKTSWGWLLGSEDKEKKEKEKEEKEAAKKRGKLSKAQSEKPHDNVRLDVLQTAAEEIKGRESLAMSREDLKLDDVLKKDTNRKSGGSDGKKEKEGGLFSSIFKKKGDRDAAKQAKTAIERTLSPEPTYRVLRADIDYNWTRFSILEERAIYRMAHIKLANPRRALYSQVLLSNFMYSYLAKVQQMHPQIQIPQYVQQKQQQQQPMQQQQHQMQMEHQQEQMVEQMGLQNPNDEFAQWSRFQNDQHKPSYNNPYDNSNNFTSSPASSVPSQSYSPNNVNLAASSQHSYSNSGFIDYENTDHQQQQQPDPWSYDHYDNGGASHSSGQEAGRRGWQPTQQGAYWDQRSQRDRRYEQQGMFGQPPPDGGGGAGEMW